MLATRYTLVLSCDIIFFMAILDIKIYPNPVLNEKSIPVTSFGEEEQAFFDDLIETMWEKDGVGLAAPQVGVSKRVLIAAPTLKKGEEYVVVNPEVLDSRGRELGPEGCLSLPGISGEVPRATKISFRYQDRFGQLHEVDVKDFFARVILHEIDHLDGILFIDRVDFDQRQRLLNLYQPA